MSLEQEPWLLMIWTDHTIVERRFDDGEARLRFIADAVRNDPNVCEVRLYSKPAPAALKVAA